MDSKSQSTNVVGDKEIPGLVNFFIFNPLLSTREGEEEKKVLFFYPPDANLDYQIKQIGLCEAMCKFTETFSLKPCQVVHTHKKRQVLFSPEHDHWLVMTVAVPSEEKMKDGTQYTEYHQEHVQDGVMEAVLQQAYAMFKLFQGTFASIVAANDGSVDALKKRLDYFYSRYLLTLRLRSADVLDLLQGIHFLPLDKHSYLTIHSFVNTLETSFPSIEFTAFLYHDFLVWSGLEQEDMRVLYRYLTTTLYPPHTESELHGQRQLTPQAHFGSFLTGPPNLADSSSLGKIPHVFVSSGGALRGFHLVVYKALSASLPMLIPDNVDLKFDFFKKLDAFVGPQLTQLASDICEQYSGRSASTETYKYIYFNHMNLATKTTVHSESRRSLAVPASLLRLLTDLLADLRCWGHDGETTVKTGDYWVVGKKSDQREVLIVLQQRNANLIDIHEEVKRLCQNHFTNIFFLD